MLLKKKNQIPEQAENHGSWSTLALKTHYFSFDFSNAIRAQQHWLCSCISKQSEDPKFQNPSYRNQVWWHFVGLNFVESSWWHVCGHGLMMLACFLYLWVCCCGSSRCARSCGGIFHTLQVMQEDADTSVIWYLQKAKLSFDINFSTIHCAEKACIYYLIYRPFAINSLHISQLSPICHT